MAVLRTTVGRAAGVPLFRNAAYLLFNSGFAAVTGFLFWVLAARLYPAAEVGIGAATIAAMTFLAALSTLGLEGGLIRFLPEERGTDSHVMVNATIVIGGGTALLVATVFALGVPLWAPDLAYLRESPVYLVLFALSTCAWTLSLGLLGVYVGSRRAGYVSLQGTVYGVLRTAALPLFAWLALSAGVLLSWAAGLIVMLAVSLLLLLRRARPGHRFAIGLSPRVLGEMLRYSFPIHLGQLAWHLPTWALPLIVVRLLGPEQNAYFYIVWVLVALLGEIPWALSISLTAEGSRDRDALGDSLRQSARATLLFLAPVVVVVVAGADVIMALFGADYRDNAAHILRLMAPGVFFVAANALHIGVLRTDKKLRRVIGLSGFLALGTIGGAVLLVPSLGLRGVALAWLATQGAGALYSTFRLVRTAWTPRRGTEGDGGTVSAASPGRPASHVPH